MKYYSLQFNYYPCPTVNMPGDNEHSRKASTALLMAEELVLKVAADNNIEMVHGYMWPDASLYKWVYSSLTPEQLTKLFDAKFQFDVDNGNKQTVSIYALRIEEWPVEEAQRLREGGALLTLEERFDFKRRRTGDHDNDEIVRLAELALAKSRSEQLENLPQQLAYSKAREECTECRPGQMGCNDCDALFKLSWAARKAFILQPRPLNGAA